MRRERTDRRVFVDTSAYYAATDAHDASHGRVVIAMRNLVTARHRFVTTNFVLADTHALLLTRLNRSVAASALEELRASQTIVRVRAKDEARAEDIIATYDDRNFTFTDGLSFAVMERPGIVRAFSLDHHFTQDGWHLIDIGSQEPGR